MTAIRKLFLALAGVTVLTSGTTAFGQVVTQPSPTEIACNASAIATLVRVQGKTEQIGDIILTCTGGTPTATGVQVPTANISIQTSQPAPGVTSKELTASLPSVNGGYPYVESLLAINDPLPAGGGASANSFVPPGTPNNIPVAPLPSTPVAASCPTSDTGTCLNYGNSVGGGGVGNSYGAVGNYNIWQGYLTPDGVTHFDGIPIDAPGTNQFTIRITNIRIDGTVLSQFVNTNNVYQNQAAAVTATIAITGTQQLATELISGVVVAVPANGIYANQPTTIPYSAVCNPNGWFAVDVMEGHAAAFKRQNNAVATVAAGVTTPAAPTPQDSFSSQYFTESGYYNPALAGHNFNSAADGVGLANQGTRIFVTFAGIPANTTVYLPTVAYLYGGSTTDVPGWLYSATARDNGLAPSGAAVLVTTDANGADAINPIAPTGTASLNGFGTNNSVPNQANGGINGAYTITIPAVTTGTGTYTAVYEVLWSDPTANETLHIPGGVQYTGGAPTYYVPTAYMTATPSLAPISPNPAGNKPDVGAFTPSDNAYPRFSPGTIAPLNEYYLIGCQCDLLFPYIVDQAGLTTGIAIANTSVDPYGDTGQSGYLSLFFYPDAGSTVGTVGTPIVQTTSNKIAGGDEFMMVVGGTGYDANSSGALAPDPGFTTGSTAGFQGYMIAIAGFQYCHGYAFITDTSVDKLAEGYLALVLDERHLDRDGGSTPACGQGCQAPSGVNAERLEN